MSKKVSNDTEIILKQISADRTFRKRLTSESHKWFFTTYFNEYIQYPTSDFQSEMFALSENNDLNLAVIVAFRGSAKSTIMSFSYPIWAVLGNLRKRHVIIISQTQPQARLLLSNIKIELETNELLKNDFGPFQEQAEIWRADTLVLPTYDARITSLSMGENIRGLRHRSVRPDLIICDDVESLESVKTSEGRDKTYKWFFGDVVPAGDKSTKIIIVGNMLHDDSLVMRLKQGLDDKKINGIFYKFPFLDSNNVPLWKEKFSTNEDVDDLKKKVGDQSSWYREYLLEIISDEGRVILPEWIHYYDKLPSLEASDRKFSYLALDLAISEKSTADFTAMVSGHLYQDGEKWYLYICPNPVNSRLDFPSTVQMAKNAYTTLAPRWNKKVLIEEVGYQKALIDQLRGMSIKVEGVKPYGNDKRSRLSITSSLIRDSRILFPRAGCEDLINQLINFGIEKHDDLADAFAYLAIYASEEAVKHNCAVADYYKALAEESKNYSNNDFSYLTNMYNTGQLRPLPYVISSLNQ